MKQLLLLVSSLVIVALISSCSNNSGANVSGPTQQQVANPINSDTVTGNIKGTMLAGKTYYVLDSIHVLAGDTLTLQAGVTCYMITKSSNPAASAVFIEGTLLSNGTQSQPNFFTTTPDKQKGFAAQGTWGGLIGDSCNMISLKWTHVDYTGGPDNQGSPRQVIHFASNAAGTSQLIIEDSWLDFGSDDGCKVYGGTGHILRNTIDDIGSTDGEAINIKNGWKGEIAYNVVWQPAGSCIKIESSSTDLTAITKVNVHNNTLINSGFRRPNEIGYGVLCDAGGQAQVWNNIIVNCRYSMFLGPDADTSNSHFGYNLLYATVDSLKGNNRYYPIDGVVDRMQSSTDIVGVDPMFTTFDGSDAALTAPLDNNNYRLKSNSPAFGKGSTNFMSTGLGDADLGAYTSNTSVSNQH
ncbi:MAG TPA: hypothetical protein VFA55_06840 [Candidatus Kapabacteria bacterium]|nr:hypothetical protein [Candidatus Kapabacteria bacterium]